jgi:hypothetical protein
MYDYWLLHVLFVNELDALGIVIRLSENGGGEGTE